MKKIYTVQMAKWRLVRDKEIPLIDITVKSGNHAFAPTWDNLKAYKEGRLTEDEYRKRYIEKMRESYRSQREEWDKLLDMPVLALACYCKAGKFCHRHILKEALMKLHARNGEEVSYEGEIS